MAPRRAHTRENQEKLPATPVADPEKMIKKGRALQRQTSRATRTSRSNLLVEGEENLSLLYLYYPDPSEFNKSPLGRTQLIKDEEAKFKIQVPIQQFTL